MEAVKIRGGKNSRLQNTHDDKLAFYGWTDYLLLNLANVKERYYPDDRADLFVLNLNRVSPELIEAIKSSQVFENVYLLQPYHQSALTSYLDKLTRLVSVRRYYRYYLAQMESFVGSARYIAFFTGAFWSESLQIIRYLFINNPKMEINFVEEGTASYLDTKRLQQCMPKSGIREVIFRYMHYSYSFRRARKQLCYMFLYRPQISNLCDNILPLSAINTTGSAEWILRQVAECIDIAPYDRTRFYYFVSPNVAGQDTSLECQSILEYIMECIPPYKVLVRLHPDIVREESKRFQDCYRGVFVETASILMEAVFYQVDIGDKVLISTNSTVLITPKLLFDKEPYIIMTHRLYKQYIDRGTQKIDRYLSLIYSIYKNKEKIFIPETEEELRSIIINLHARQI